MERFGAWTTKDKTGNGRTSKVHGFEQALRDNIQIGAHAAFVEKRLEQNKRLKASRASDQTMRTRNRLKMNVKVTKACTMIHLPLPVRALLS